MSFRPVYSLVVPIYNEEAVLPLLFERLDGLMERLDGPTEAIFVDDGSRDRSAAILDAKVAQEPRYRYVKLSRNFGHQIAITTGMDVASGEAVVIMDADLQDPPELVLELAAKWREGFELVCAQRVARRGEGAFKRASADLFYRLISRIASVEITRDVGDFALIDRKALRQFLAMPERDRFVRGMFAWLGFRRAIVTFERAPRAAGRSNYPLGKMFGLALSGIVSFSDAPLRLALWAGIGVSVLAMIYGCYVIGLSLTHAELVPGWSSTVVVTSLLCGVNMMMTGIMGLYVGRIHAEVKGRPLYVVDRTRGFSEARPEPTSAPAAADVRTQLAGLEAKLRDGIGRRAS